MEPAAAGVTPPGERLYHRQQMREQDSLNEPPPTRHLSGYIKLYITNL